MKPLRISRFTATSALGLGVAAQLDALRGERSGLTAAAFDTCTLPTWTGPVAGVDEVKLAPGDERWDCRNNRLAWLGLAQDGFLDSARGAVARYGARRIGVFMGTSTSGLHQTGLAYHDRQPDGRLPGWFNYRDTHSPDSLSRFVSSVTGAQGPSLTISTACSSSAKVFASAHRAMSAGLCDAAIVGGVDSLCLMTLYGFNALQLVSKQKCRPADADRDGISIGEGAGFALLEWPERSANGALLLGYGESSDAHHMSSPEPEGRGAFAAMQDALTRAGLGASAIDYVNLHGTATRANDAAEDKAVFALFGDATPCSSTKGFTGHALGAAGIVEAVFGLLAIEHGFLPRSLNTVEKDPTLKSAVLLETQEKKVSRVLSNSFGFGGSNCSLVLASAE